MFERPNPKCRKCESEYPMRKVIVLKPHNKREVYFKCHECGSTFIRGDLDIPLIRN